jgi:hypothetical protein
VATTRVCVQAVSTVSTSASKEYSLRRALAKMKEEWGDKEFYCIPYKDSGTAVIGQTDEIQMLLDDQLMKVQAMNASPFVKPFKAETVEWEATLQFLQVGASCSPSEQMSASPFACLVGSKEMRGHWSPEVAIWRCTLSNSLPCRT